MPPRSRPPLLLLLLAAATSACTGPALHIDNPGGHRVFVDGVEQTAATLPFRYYGTTRWDADPAARGERPDWSLLPASGFVDVPEPVSPWWFPLDFPLELAARALYGREDATATIVLPPAPTAALPPDLAATTARATAARTSR